MYILFQVALESSEDISCKPVRLDRLEPLLTLLVTLPRDLTIYLLTHGSNPQSHWFTAADVHLGPLSK